MSRLHTRLALAIVLGCLLALGIAAASLSLETQETAAQPRKAKFRQFVVDAKGQQTIAWSEEGGSHSDTCQPWSLRVGRSESKFMVKGARLLGVLPHGLGGRTTTLTGEGERSYRSRFRSQSSASDCISCDGLWFTPPPYCGPPAQEDPAPPNDCGPRKLQGSLTIGIVKKGERFTIPPGTRMRRAPDDFLYVEVQLGPKSPWRACPSILLDAVGFGFKRYDEKLGRLRKGEELIARTERQTRSCPRSITTPPAPNWRIECVFQQEIDLTFKPVK